MTISLNNTTYETCTICGKDFTDIEREDTKKTVTLACDHFYHMNCLSEWFSMNETKGRDLSCCYCTKVSMPKLQPTTSINLETLIDFFESVEKNPIFQSDLAVINCVAKLRSLSESLVELLNGIHLVDQASVTEGVKKTTDWIEANIQRELRQTAAQLIAKMVNGGGTLRTLEQQIEYLARIPYDKWPAAAEKLGIPVYHSVNGELKFRMRVSKQYLQRATAAYLCERMQNSKILEMHLKEIELDYFHDREVLEAIPHARNLQKDFSKLLRDNPISSIEEIFLSLEETIKKRNIKDDVKENVRLIINKFVFRLGALRTLTQEIERWKKIPIESWPLAIRARGVRVLDENNEVKHYEKKDFLELVHPTLPPAKNSGLLTPLLVGVVVCFVAKRIFNSIGRNLQPSFG